MAVDMQEKLREVLRSAASSAADVSPKKGGKGLLSGGRGLAVGAGAAALAPLAAKGVGKLARTVAADGLRGVVKAPGDALGDFTSNLGQSVGRGAANKVTDKLDQEGGPSGILADTVKGVLPFGGDSGGGGGKGGAPGVGKGRRMPVQQSVDIGAPIETVYNQWTQFEDWPNFMHRVTRVTQEDDCTVSFATKIWGKTKEFTAEIETQRPNERIKWRVSQGLTHTGVVTFHELGPNLTRVLLGMDVEPGGLLEKAARGMRHVKRAARADLHRFKALIEMSDQETGAWRGVIEDGEVVEEHDPSYDEQREYAELDDITGESEEEDKDESDDEDENNDEDESEEAEASGDTDDEDERQEPRRTGGRSRRAAPTRPSAGQRSRGHGGRGRTESRGSRKR
jgi:uncharacterized protein YndB with AHSA1/START domain